MENEELVSGLSFQEEENRVTRLGSLELDISGLFASVSKRVFMSNHWYENVCDLQRHFHGNQIYFHGENFAIRIALKQRQN